MAKIKHPWLSALLNITTGGAGYIYNNSDRKILGWGLFLTWGLSMAERFMYHNPIEKPTPLTYVYPAVALLAFAIDGYLEAKRKNQRETTTFSSRIMGALRVKK